MTDEWLTVSLVEDIQRALMTGRNVEPVVARVKYLTMPALVEYGCMRWVLGDRVVPPLPDSVLGSSLAAALHEVRFPIGLRHTGLQKGTVADIAVREEEFMVVGPLARLDDQEWQLFEARFNRSAQSGGLAKSRADMLQAALHEMAENVVIHSQSKEGGLVGYRILSGAVQFCVADVGVGVRASLRTNKAYEGIKTDKDAIREALKDGVTRFSKGYGGLGFRQVFKSLAAEWGLLRFRSGHGCIMMDGRDLAADRGKEYFPPNLPGFQVSVVCHSPSSRCFAPLF